MSKLMMAVCDTDEGYRNRFVTYLVEHRSKDIAVHAFSTLELFLDSIKDMSFDIAVFGRGFEQAKDAVKERGIPLLLLTDVMPESVAEPFGYPEAEMSWCEQVFRYQPMETILHEIQVLTGSGRMAKTAVEVHGGRMEVIGIYSPIGHEMQMPFAMVLSEFLGERRKVLYVNLMEHSGFLKLFQLAGEYDMGDVVLKLRSGRLRPETFLKSVYELEGMYYIPPFDNPENLHDFALEDYLGFLKFLEEQTDFEAVVLDFGAGLEHFGKMLAYCTSIYCLTKGGYFFECQMEHFMEYFTQETGEASKQLHIVSLPFSAKRIRGGGDVRRQLLWSDFGDHVRGYFSGGGV